MSRRSAKKKKKVERATEKRRQWRVHKREGGKNPDRALYPWQERPDRQAREPDNEPEASHCRRLDSCGRTYATRGGGESRGGRGACAVGHWVASRRTPFKGKT